MVIRGCPHIKNIGDNKGVLGPSRPRSLHCPTKAPLITIKRTLSFSNLDKFTAKGLGRRAQDRALPPATAHGNRPPMAASI